MWSVLGWIGGCGPIDVCGLESCMWIYDCVGVSTPMACFVWGSDVYILGFVAKSLSCVQFFATPRTVACQAFLSSVFSWSLCKLMSIELVMPSNHLIYPLSSPSPPAFNLSQHQGLFNESALHIRWPKYWSFSFSISPSNEYSELISFRIDCFDLFAVQGTLKSLLLYHSSNASILWHSACFMVQLSHPYMTTGKTIVLTIWTFVDK